MYEDVGDAMSEAQREESGVYKGVRRLVTASDEVCSGESGEACECMQGPSLQTQMPRHDRFRIAHVDRGTIRLATPGKTRIFCFPGSV